MTNSTLEGRSAVVTGASSGIGRAIAIALGGAGVHVTLGGRTASAMEDVKKKIESDGGRAQVVVLDVRDPAQVRGLIDTAVEANGGLDIMVNKPADHSPNTGSQQ
jgi:NADP-dependent 3-hydroxy acid dehydrogenase YdfG